MKVIGEKESRPSLVSALHANSQRLQPLTKAECPNPRGAPCPGADFEGARLAGTNFSGANLFEADLTEAHLGNAVLRNALLRGAGISGTDFSGANLTGIRSGVTGTPSALPEGYALVNGYLIGPGAILSNASPWRPNADLSGADLRGVDLAGANLTESNLDGVLTTWHENGQKAEEGTYKDGERDGLHTEWHENGQKMVEATYKDGEEVSETWWNSKGEEVDSWEEAE